MKPQEDIGSFIKTKLQSTEKPSNEETWDRIQSSLKERKKKKRFVFFLKWGSGIALFLIVGLFALNNSNDTSNTKPVTSSQTDEINTATSSKIKDTETNTIDTNSDTDANTLSSLKEEGVTTTSQDIPTKNDMISQEGTSKPKTEALTSNTKELGTQETTPKSTTVSTIKETSIKDASVKDTSIDKEATSNIPVVQTEKIATDNSSKKTPKNNAAIDTIVNRNDVPVTHTSKKIYYYYNSKNGQEMSSTDKRVIDSIMKANKPKQDSLKID